MYWIIHNVGALLHPYMDEDKIIWTNSSIQRMYKYNLCNLCKYINTSYLFPNNKTIGLYFSYVINKVNKFGFRNIDIRLN